ncbi:prenylated Rab acceptor protein 1-like isoform X1 [Mytilus californianus]|uniref:prenylated Rab acceptor protein 1-like isoform X1 n=2 Tax=Mytilus californianus TaxID=6549 RepID=UPI002246F67C|nr:prenylated Rab acceptor protein 1-like isoform X1 [Mytilus californianus]
MTDTKLDFGNIAGDIDIPDKQSSLKGKGRISGFKARIMSLSLSNVSAREWISKTREGIKPWGEFISTSRFKVPKSVKPVPGRVMKNIEHFQSNYMFVFLGLVLFCVLTSPMLLVAIAACLGACYIISLKNAENKLKILGKELSVGQQYAVVGVCSFPLFWLAGAGSAVFWIIGASFFFIMLHASMYMTPDEQEAVELEMDEVV